MSSLATAHRLTGDNESLSSPFSLFQTDVAALAGKKERACNARLMAIYLCRHSARANCSTHVPCLVFAKLANCTELVYLRMHA